MQDMIIGVDVGGTQLRAVLADSAGKIQKRIAVPTNSFEGRDAVLNRIRQLIRDVCKSCEWDQIRGIGIGVPGPTDPFAGLVIIAPNIPGWLNVDLLGELTPFFDCPIFVGNDANLAGLAEHRFGAGQGTAHMIFLTVSTGVGGGIIVDNRMLLGQRGFGAEVGHMTIEARHAPNAEGILGTLEDLAAGPGIARRAKAALRKGATSSLLSTVNGDIDAITPKMITEAAHAGDPFAIEHFRQTGYYLGVGITNLLHIFNPERIVIGGSVWLNAGGLLAVPVWDTLRSRAKSPEYYQKLEIVSAALGDDAGLLGAVALAQSELEQSQIAGS